MGEKLEKAIKDINKNADYKLIKDEISYCEIEKIPFPSPKVSWQLYGGLPLGRMTEIAGEENSGKTTTALGFCGEAQKMYPEKDAIFIDAEHTLDMAWANKLGVNTDKLKVMQPEIENAEEILNYMIKLLKTGEISVMVLDSVPALISKAKHNEDIGTQTYAGIAQPMTDFLQKAIRILKRYNTSLFIINQVRDDIDNPWNDFRTPGGRALKHFASLRLFARKGKLLDADYKEKSRRYENPVGHKVDLRIMKTQICKPDRPETSYVLNFMKGIDVFHDTINVAQEYDIIVRAGPWYRIINPDTGEVLTDEEGEELKFQGQNKLEEKLKEEEELYKNIKERVLQKVREKDE